MRRALADTNVLIDLVDAGRLGHESALSLFSCDDVDVCALVSSLKDVYYVLCRLYHDEARARGDVRVIMAASTVLGLVASDAEVAVDSDSPDFEDGLVRATAESAGADVILTRDASAFANARLAHMPAGDYLACL